MNKTSLPREATNDLIEKIRYLGCAFIEERARYKYVLFNGCMPSYLVIKLTKQEEAEILQDTECC